MKKTTLMLTTAVAVGLLAATAISARGLARPAAAAAPAPSAPRAMVAADGRVVAYPGGEVVVGAERAGRVVRLLVDEGTAVRKGALLAELESDELRADGFPGRAWAGRVEEIPGSVTLRRLKPQDPGRPTDTRVLAVKVAFAEATPLKLGTTVELEIVGVPVR